MAINFTQIFKDSLNFMRNQRHIMLSFIVIKILITFFILFISPSIEFIDGAKLPPSQQIQQVVDTFLKPEVFGSILFNSAIELFFSYFCLLAIHQIGRREKFAISQLIGQTLSRFFGTLSLTILTLLVFLIGLSQITYQLATAGSNPLLSSIISFVGIFIFVRLNLAPISYLFGHQSFINAIPNSWQRGIGRSGSLFIFVLLIYFLLPILVQPVNAILGNSLFSSAIVMVLHSIIYVFSLVFTYRFYTIFFTQQD